MEASVLKAPKKVATRPPALKKPDYSNWFPLLEISSTHCCGLYILNGFYNYRNKTSMAWVPPGTPAHEGGSQWRQSVYSAQLKAQSQKKRLDYPTFPESGDIVFERDVKTCIGRADVKPAAQILAILTEEQRALYGESLEGLDFDIVVDRAVSKKTGHKLTTYIKVMHETEAEKKKFDPVNAVLDDDISF